MIGMAGRGIDAFPTFDIDDPMCVSSCVACGECVQACPTGALMEKSMLDETSTQGTEYAEKTVKTVCPFCGVGCQTEVSVKGNDIIKVDGRQGPANRGKQCVRGRFGMDYVMSPERLTKPLIWRDDSPKRADQPLDLAQLGDYFRETTWEEAMERAAGGFNTILERDGGQALCGFDSAKGTNEEAYLFQKFIRQGFGTNNVDHCTRLCHASSVAALIESVGSGSVSHHSPQLMTAIASS
ncbi:MAG: formate dehydrogenase major subunit [Alteromonas macleodii]|jgi:formate dehydrogenase major subunit